MTARRDLCFGSYRLDVSNERVWRGRRAIKLTSKAFSVLQYLATHPERLVTKDELFRVVWGTVVVSDSALTVCIREIRKALGDDAKIPRIIETVHRRGYRFVAPLAARLASRRKATGARGTISPPPRLQPSASASEHKDETPTGEIAAELAMHFEHGQEYARAVHYLEQAAKNATQRSAHGEAIAHLTKGVTLLERLPDTPERAQHELTLQVALGMALIAANGYAASEVARAFARARELCQREDASPSLFRVLLGLYAFYLLRAELKIARELSERLLAVAERLSRPTLLLWAHFALGETFHSLGELPPARQHLEQAMALYDPRQYRPHAFDVHDPGAPCVSFTAWVLWDLGYLEQAHRRKREALSLAQALAHPPTSVFVLNFAALFHHFCHEPEETKKLAEAAVMIAEEHGFAYQLAMAKILRGWALAEQGQGEAGMAELRQGLEDYRATGAELMRPYFLSLLAETCGKLDRTEEALALLNSAIAEANATGEHVYDARLYQLKGELLLMSRDKQIR